MSQTSDTECQYCNEQTRNAVQLQCAHQVCLHCAHEMFLLASLKQAEVSSDDLAAKANRKFNAAMTASTSSAQQQEEDNLDMKCTHIGIHCPQCNQQTLIEHALGPQPISSAQGNEYYDEINSFAKQLYKNQQESVNSIDMIEQCKHDSQVAELNLRIAQLSQQIKDLESRPAAVIPAPCNHESTIH